jgi:hypothetical protein
MSFGEFKKAGLALRLLTVFALTLALLFTLLVILENKELNKLAAPSPARKLALLFAYSGTILLTNYFLALRGRNLLDWRNELLIASNFVLFFAVSGLPFLFPSKITSGCPWWKPLCKSALDITPNLGMLWLFVLLFPLVIYTGRSVRAYVAMAENEKRQAPD